MVILTYLYMKVTNSSDFWGSPGPKRGTVLQAHGGSSMSSVLGFAWDSGHATIGAGTVRAVDLKMFLWGPQL